MIKENLTDFTKPVTTLLSLANGQTATGALQQLVVDPARDSSGNPIPCGDSGASCAYVASQSVQIPSTIPRRNANGTGTYYALLSTSTTSAWCPSSTRTTTSSRAAPSPFGRRGYGFLGLQTPCSGLHVRQDGHDAPGLAVHEWIAAGGHGHEPPAPEVLALDVPTPTSTHPATRTTAQVASSAPNAADLTSGNSGWQYFPNPGMSRPQYSWQFNFDATGLPRGSCYTMWVEIPSTGRCRSRPTRAQAVRTVLDHAAVGRRRTQAQGSDRQDGVDRRPRAKSRPPVCLYRDEGEAGASPCYT